MSDLEINVKSINPAPPLEGIASERIWSGDVVSAVVDGEIGFVVPGFSYRPWRDGDIPEGVSLDNVAAGQKFRLVRKTMPNTFKTGSVYFLSRTKLV